MHYMSLSWWNLSSNLILCKIHFVNNLHIFYEQIGIFLNENNMFGNFVY